DLDPRGRQHLGDDLEGDLERQHHAGGAVAEVVEAPPVEAGLLEQPLEPHRDVLPVERLTEAVGEHELDFPALVLQDGPRGARSLTLALLAHQMLPEGCGDWSGERQGARRLLGSGAPYR